MPGKQRLGRARQECGTKQIKGTKLPGLSRAEQLCCPEQAVPDHPTCPRLWHNEPGTATSLLAPQPCLHCTSVPPACASRGDSQPCILWAPASTALCWAVRPGAWLAEGMESSRRAAGLCPSWAVAPRPAPVSEEGEGEGFGSGVPPLPEAGTHWFIPEHPGTRGAALTPAMLALSCLQPP